MENIKLTKECEIELKTEAPFNFPDTIFKPSHYQSEIIKYVDNTLYQTMRVDGNLYGITLSELNDIMLAKIFSVTDIDSETKQKIKDELHIRYDLDGNISNFLNDYKDDSVLSGPIERRGGMHPSCSYSLYEFLMITVMLQNTTVRRSAAMTNSMLESFGNKVSFDGQDLFAVWKPEDIDKVSEEDLRNLRIGYRAKTIKRISEAFTEGNINEVELRKLPKEQAKKALLEIYGVGPQSVSYLLFEYLHFYDALDHLSPWESKLVSMLIFGDKSHPGEEIVEYLKQDYPGWEALAVHYLIEDIFAQRKEKNIPWLEEEIRS